MRGHHRVDFDTKVTEFATFLRQQTPNENTTETSEVLSQNEEELLRKFGKFLEVEREKHPHHGHGKFGHGHHGKFGHGHHGKFGHGHHGKFGHGHHGMFGPDHHRGHHKHHGHHHGHHGFKKHFYFNMFKEMLERSEGGVCSPMPVDKEAINTPQEANKTCNCDCQSRWDRSGKHKFGHRHHRKGRCITGSVAPVENAAQTEAAMDSDSSQTLVATFESIEIANSPAKE